MAINNNFEFKKVIDKIDIHNKPNIFLHVCCGPCSSGVLYRLVDYFNIFIIFFNPNIDTFLEYNLRLYELKHFIEVTNSNYKIIYSDYNHIDFLNSIVGFENDVEGGKRCEKCFELRLNESFNIAYKYIKEHNLLTAKNYLCTTLSISPHKDAELINKIGKKICENSIIEYLMSDFKKDNGYLNSINISKKYGLYRQNYCGCEFSKYE